MRVLLVLGAVLASGCATMRTQEPSLFRVEEATIADIHAAMRGGRLGVRELVQGYLNRIQAYDKRGPAINSIITINPDALRVADSLDARLARGDMVGSLFGIPVCVKDNYDTSDLPTSAGSLSLMKSVPPKDAFVIRKLREAGAIVLVKTNMYEFSYSGQETVGSALAGYSRNPYATNRTTAGSSGGSAAAVAANLCAVGLGTDTGASIRGPASHQSLVGLRTTVGLTSRTGIVPLNLERDVSGPLTRTVVDLAIVLDVMAGTDPADRWTAHANEHQPAHYTDVLRANALKGARIGVLRRMANTDSSDAEVIKRFDDALATLRNQGAIVVDSVVIPAEPDSSAARDSASSCNRFRYDVNQYLAHLGPGAPKTLADIIKSGKFHPNLRAILNSAEAFKENPDSSARCRAADLRAQNLRARVRGALAAQRLDALVYPSWNNPPRLIGDLNTTPHGSNNHILAPPTGFPAISVPMGYVRDGLPVGLQFFGDAWSEPRLIAYAYAYEQATHYRRAPASTPPLPQHPK